MARIVAKANIFSSAKIVLEVSAVDEFQVVS